MAKSSSRSPKSTGIKELKDLTREIQRAPGFPEVVAALRNGRSATVDGAWGSASALVSAALGLHAPSAMVVLLAHVGDVDDFRDDVATFAGIVPEVFPAWEKLPRELNAADEVFPRVFPVVAQAAEAGNTQAQSLLRSAAQEITVLADALVDRLKLRDSAIYIAKTGGMVTASKFFDAQLDAELKKIAPCATIGLLPVAPAEVAARLALELISSSANPPAQQATGQHSTGK